MVKALEKVEKVIPYPNDLSLEIFVSNHEEVVGDLIAHAVQNQVVIKSFEVNEPNLESLFLSLTGRSLRD